MEQELKLVLLRSLKEMALRSVAAIFWNDPHIFSPLCDYEREEELGFYKQQKRNWIATIEDKIKSKIMKLVIPEPLKERLTALIGPLRSEVLVWKQTNQYFLHTKSVKFDVLTMYSMSPKLRWTSAGTISYRKTAEELVRCCDMNVEARYELACYYCLEDCISQFWKELPEESRKKYSHYEDLSTLLPYCWPLILQGKQSELDILWKTSKRNRTSFNHKKKLTSFNQYAFEKSTKMLCKTAANYFLQKLTHEERETSLMDSIYNVMDVLDSRRLKFHFPSEKPSDVLLFLLSAMAPKQRMEILAWEPSAFEIFFCFLYWPQQDLYLENAALLWNIIPSPYFGLIETFIHRYEYSNIYFPKMFKLFFTHSPQDFKTEFVEKVFTYSDTAAGNLMRVLFREGDSEDIKAFFRTLKARDRVKIVFQHGVLQLFNSIVVHRGCDLVLLCLQEAFLSKEEKKRMKEAFMSYPKYLQERASVEWKFKRIFDFLDETDTSSDVLKTGKKNRIKSCCTE